MLMAALIAFIISHNNRPLDSSVTISGIQAGVQAQENYILAKVGDSYYETASANSFSTLFLFDEWKVAQAIPAEGPVVSLQFAELWVVDIYSDGTVAAYNGYAPRKYQESAYYIMPEVAVAEIIAYLEETATPHYLGDGTIGQSTFRH